MKSVKKIVSENCSPSGELNTDTFSLALLNYRNTPCRHLGQSPAQILFCRNLKDALPQSKLSLNLRPEWIRTAEWREKALSKKHIASTEVWSRGVRSKDQLKIGESVAVQNMTGKTKHLWSLSGTIVDVSGPDSYWIKLDGSGRLSKRKRQHIKVIIPFITQKLTVDGDLEVKKSLKQMIKNHLLQ